ncbi:MFS transporter [Acidocella sp.]|uniref:MFS transporter n=1 Tax=Acidocella sp. TaxID=50710 RepID=UPI002624DF15|nr:MFS transporter [Acidocella sp.]
MLSQSTYLSSDPGTIRKGTALALVVAGFVTFVNMWCTQAILPVLAKSLHVSPALTGYTVTAPLLATAAVAPIIGTISDRTGRRVFIRGAALLLVIPTVLAAFSTSLAMLIACRFTQGLLLPFIFTVTIAYISDEMSPTNAMKMVGIYTSGTISGGFSGRLIVGFITSLFNWRAAFLVIGLITLTAALTIAFLLPQEKHFKPNTSISGALASFPDHLSNKRLLGTYAVGFGVLFSLVSVFTFINFRLAEAPYNLGPAALGAIFVVYLGGVAVSPVAGKLGARTNQRTLMAGCIGLVLTGLTLTLASPLWLICLGLLMICLGIFPQQTLATGFVGVAARSARSTAVGLYVTFYYIGGSFGGVVPAAAWHSTGWIGCAAITALVQLCMLGFAWKTWREA